MYFGEGRACRIKGLCASSSCVSPGLTCERLGLAQIVPVHLHIAFGRADSRQKADTSFRPTRTSAAHVRGTSVRTHGLHVHEHDRRDASRSGHYEAPV
eukprot:5596317-Prymnesium_polylepis.1